MPYTDTSHLPFNFESIRDRFRFAPPGTEVSGDAGFWIVLRGGALVVEANDGAFSLPHGGFPRWTGAAPSTAIAAGFWDGEPLKVLSIGKEKELPAGFVAEPFNAAADRLPDTLLTLGGLGNQILAWLKRSARCAVCGSPTDIITGTWGKRCSGCGSEHFPHIHPCAIVLVRRGNDLLLVRKAEWAPGRYGLVAGFLDFAESLEECVQREVMEETGIRVTDVRYVGSQSWPFPSQLMAGFVATWEAGEPEAREELEDARWFPADRLPDSLPPKRSIARWIIDTFGSADGGTSCSR